MTRLFSALLAGVLVLLALSVARPRASQTSTPSTTAPRATAACPPSGRGHEGAPAAGSDEAMRNQRKRTIPKGPAAQAKLLTLGDFKSLQAQVDAQFRGEERPIFTGNRSSLQNLKIAGGTISEGDVVRVVGFLAAARAEGAESVNCESLTVVDFHINVGPTKTATEFQGIVVEIIPQNPPTGLNSTHALEKALTKVVTGKMMVMVVGQLMLDNEHLVNDDPAHPKGSNPKRISTWEVHPVTTFFVCQRATCDPAQSSQWTPLQGLKS